ncbi:transcription termination factor NusA [Desulfobotulus sp. H1]|uniref:Transcription termination/antitermination protein NusA n=1 Tax=Desulfobotulus pelophilus TaxID=2823377 RepID=A0ABT3NCK4_9BACT|nr:transcription termination factor NusA [Desulfobotulus pelophilus]MCW7755178.1 transcription termination factor NusA [Desulfobotulus pelophilus]
MLFSDIKRVIEQVSRDKGIPMETLIHTLEEALESAAKKKLGSHIDVEAQYNPDSGEIEVFQFREVVEDITNPDFQLSLENGRKLDPDCEIGDSLGTKLDTTSFGRIAAQSAKQVIIQKVKDAERNAVYEGFIDRKGEIINGIVQRVDRGDIIVNLGQTEALLPAREQIPRETYRRGDRIRASIMKVLQDSRGPQIVLSRTHPQFLIALFRSEVPEVAEGVVTIETASREPGVRAKIAVSSQDSGVDPVGACVGMKGSRVQAVVQELRGEKIDIISWSPDAARFVCNALAPAEILRVVIDEDNRAMEVIVPDEFLSIAIGKKGQNVRLASRLTGWHLDVKSEASYSLAMKEGYATLMKIPGVGMTLAEALYSEGFTSPQDVADATIEDLLQVEGMDAETAEAIIEAAQQENTPANNTNRPGPGIFADRESTDTASAETAPDTTTIEENRQVPADEAATPESENE